MNACRTETSEEEEERLRNWKQDDERIVTEGVWKVSEASKALFEAKVREIDIAATQLSQYWPMMKDYAMFAGGMIEGYPFLHDGAFVGVRFHLV
jgi:hypothetical protein